MYTSNRQRKSLTSGGTTCLIRPHVFSTALLDCLIRLIEFATRIDK